MIKLKDLLFEQWTKGMGKPLSKSEISTLEKKLKVPTVRDPKKGGMIIPPKLSEREKNHIIFVMLKKTRDKNAKKGLGKIQKHWTKMSKAERMHLDRLARGEGTTGSRPMK
tara:strand:- start:318 stop:650 length:333 start_codon:yes stop_codon:yes gene_type:complete